MCLFRKPDIPTAAPQLIPAGANAESQREADLEDALRRRRAGAAANVLTSPIGIPGGTAPRTGTARGATTTRLGRAAA